MRRIRLASVTTLACACVLACASQAAARTWVGKNGETINGEFVRVYNGQVIISRGGRVATFPLNLLSDADQNYIRKKVGLPPKPVSPSSRGGSGGGGHGSTLPKVSKGPGYWAPEDPDFSSESSEEDSQSSSGNSDGFDDSELDFVVEREWTDVQGRKIRAKLVPRDDASGKVTLLKDGKTFEIPRERLSPEDITYVDEMRERIARLRRETGQQKGAVAGGSSSGAQEKKSPFPTWKPPGYGSNHSGGNSPSPSETARANSPGANSPGTQPDPARSSPWPSNRSRHTSPSGGTPPQRGFGSHRGHSPPNELASPGHPRFGPRSTPRMPTIPNTPQMQREVFTCSKCGKVLPDDVGAGDRCPYCGVYFQYEEGADGKRKYAPGYWVGSAFGVLLFLGGIAFRMIRNVS